VVAFAVLYLVLPTSYAVGNIAKRPVIIAVSIGVFKNTVSTLNIIGILVTVIGASLFTYFELDEENSNESQPDSVEAPKDNPPPGTELTPIKPIDGHQAKAIKSM